MSIDYCGYTIRVTIESHHVTISPAKEKANALLDLPQPKNKTKL